MKPLANLQPLWINRATEVMRTCPKIFAACLLVTIKIQSQAAVSTVQISNLSVPWTGGGIGNIHAVTPNQRFGFGFTVGASALQLNSAVLEHISYPGSLQSFGVELYRVNSFSPFGSVSTTLLGTLGYSAIDPRATQWPGDTTFVRYSSATSMLLEPGTTYLIAAVEPANGLNETGILFATSGSGYSVSGDWAPSFANQFFSDSTSPWMVGPQFGNLKIEINATVVPEPAIASLLALGIGCLLSRRGSKCVN